MPTTLENRISRMRLPSYERDAVTDLTSAIRRHADQSPSRLAQLVNIAFGFVVSPVESREKKLGRAYIRGLEARQQLMEAEGGSLSSDEAARMLQISKTAALKRLASGRLLAWQEERLQAKRFPCWQFNAHGQVLRGLEETLTILNKCARLDVWGKMLFFLQKKPNLDGQRPLDLLREGKLREIRLAAEAYAE